MIIDELIVENFGVFRGRQSIQLTPSGIDKPIILIGGLNGGGKTTLLDALQLALYGRFARCSNRENLSYDEFIRRSVHRGIGPKDSVSVEVRFRRLMQGEEQHYIVRRTWDSAAQSPSESVRVVINGAPDATLTEGWLEHIESIIPQGVSTLFFFDGEKIEELATPKSATTVLSTAINSLLGLDVVDRLNDDLVVFGRRKAIEGKSETENQKIQTIEAEISTLETILENAETERAGCQNEFDQSQRALKEAEERYQKEGGILLARREENERDSANAKLEFEKKRVEFRHYAAGPSPLCLVDEHLQDISLQLVREHAHQDALTFAKLLERRDDKILAQYRRAKIDARQLRVLERLLHEDRNQRLPSRRFKSFLCMDRSALILIAQLIKTALPSAKREGKEIRTEIERQKEALANSEKIRASVPEQEMVAHISGILKKMKTEFNDAAAKLNLADSKITQTRREIDQKKANLVRLIESEIEAKLESSDTRRIITHISRVRTTLYVFRDAIVSRHVKRIEYFVLECFRQLLHKTSLVSEIRIDSRSYGLTLLGRDGQPLPSERLSAGERQLLSVALLWGLAKAAGRALPTFIDTPLGRLDATHRRHLVGRYFPFASHQVVLLSTDKEIESDHLASLAPYITREFTLVHDDREGFTRIVDGYFKN